MPEPVTVVAALAALAAWLKLLQEQLKDRRQRLNEAEGRAINALFDAVNATNQYVRNAGPPVGSGSGPRDAGAEQDIAMLWRGASDAIYKIDPELAYRCQVKAGYWDRPDGWDATAISAANISLRAIFEAARELRRKP